MERSKILVVLLGLGLLLVSCTRPPPQHENNICSIFRQYPDWYWATQEVQKKWGVPISVQMAIVLQESHFHAKAKPPRKKLLWVIPWFRPTSAYGYSQAVDHTWRLYRRDTGKRSASRSAFDDAVDFVGWFAWRAHKKIGISKANAFQVYLAYHEGLGGFERKTYRRKPWLKHVAYKVQRHAWIYHAELLRCQRYLKKKPWWRKIL